MLHDIDIAMSEFIQVQNRYLLYKGNTVGVRSLADSRDTQRSRNTVGHHETHTRSSVFLGS